MAARHAFDKSRGTNSILPHFFAKSSTLKPLCVDHPVEQRARGQPQLQADALLLGRRLFLQTPPMTFSLRLGPKSSALCGLHTIQCSPSQTFPIPYPTDHRGRKCCTAAPGIFRGKATGGQTRFASLAQISGAESKQCCMQEADSNRRGLF